MAPGVVIIGADGSGKTREALAIASSYHANEVTVIEGRGLDLSSTFAYSSCTKDTKVVIVDNIIKLNLLHQLILFSIEPLIVNKFGENTIYIQLEKIIVTCAEEIKRHHLSRYLGVNIKFEIVELTH